MCTTQEDSRQKQKYLRKRSNLNDLTLRRFVCKFAVGELQWQAMSTDRVFCLFGLDYLAVRAAEFGGVHEISFSSLYSVAAFSPRCSGSHVAKCHHWLNAQFQTIICRIPFWFCEATVVRAQLFTSIHLLPCTL